MARAFGSITLAAVLLAATVSIQAQNTAACQSVRFSDEVLERFPGAPASCLDVITREGTQYAVFKAQLTDVRGSDVRVRVKNPDGTHGETKTIRTKPGRKVLINGQPYPVSELAADQEITVYVRVDRPMIALAPVSESDPLDATPLMQPERETQAIRVSSAGQPSMPHTASPIGAVALLGQFCLAAGLGLMVIRKRRK